MMKFILNTLFLFLVSIHVVVAQNFVFPILSKHGKNIKDFIPGRWTVIDSIHGDLNRDNQEDLALILEYYTPVKEKRAYGDNNTDLITELQKPRILAVYFKNKNAYTLSLQNNDFILRGEEGGALGDPLKPMTISENKICLNFSGGGSWKWKLDYTFVYQNDDWYLAKANNTSTHDVTGETITKIYDFLTKKVQITEITPFSRSSSPNTSILRELKINRLRTFSTFKKPWTWQIGQDEFL